MKVIIVVLLIVVLISLFIALRAMVSDRTAPNKMVKALTWRIGLSILIFALLYLGHYLGLIEPHGLIP